MALSLVTGPAIEPVTLDEAKAQIRVTNDDENGLIATLITAGREYAESFTHRAFVTQTWDLKLDQFPCDEVYLPMAPLQSVTSISYVDTNGTTQTLSTSYYTVDAPAGPKARRGCVSLAYQQAWPQTRSIENAVTVRFIAGYGSVSASVPGVIKVAIKQWIADAWSQRGNVVIGTIVTPIEQSCDRLLWPYKSF